MRVFLVATAVSLACTGCMGSQPKVMVMRYTDQVFPPSTHVEALHTVAPNRTYIEIGEVSIRIAHGNKDTAVILLRQECERLGADALILMGERSCGAIAIPVGDTVLARPLNEIYGIAIRYK